jgi:serine/threonine protein kinase/predicted ATPase
LELIGRGGMAEVYKAKSHGVEGFEKLVVIKRILPEFSQHPAFVDLFITEAKTAVTLSHANIVQVFDLGRADDSYFIAMEYVHGIDLGEMLHRSQTISRPLPPELAVYLVSEVAKGLDYAHRRRDVELHPQGVVHRDISPQNILVSFEGEVKITDFGIARALGAVNNQGTPWPGKGDYAAPEQVAGAEVDQRSDIFSLGVVLYELLAQRPPWDEPAEGPGAFPEMPRRYHPLAAVAPAVPEPLRDIVERALDPTPDLRHRDAGRLYEELLSFLYNAGERVDANDLVGYFELLQPPPVVPSTEGSPGKSPTTHGSSQVSPAPRELAATPVLRPATTFTPVEIPPIDESPTAPRQPSQLWEITALAWEVFGGPCPEPLRQRIRQTVEGEGGSLADEQENFGVALFGLQQREGRDTETAINVGRQLLQLTRHELDDDKELAFGVHSGQVVVTCHDRPTPREDVGYFSLVDKARFLAGRQPGHVIVSDEARHAGHELFHFTPIERGQWLVDRQRSLGEVYQRFVGRHDALRTVGEHLSAAANGSGNVLFLVGEAGIGKTRLLHETRRRLAAGGHDFNWHQVRCGAHWQDVPFAGLQVMLRSLLGLAEAAPSATVKEKVERLRQLGLASEQVDAVGQLMGLPNTRQAHRTGQLDRELRLALIHIATKLAQDRLTVLVWDGGNAMDRASLAALAALAQGARWSRVLVLIAARPPLPSTWKVIPYQHRLRLEPLPHGDVRQLVQYRLGTKEVPESLQTAVASQAFGNPLYIEQYIKMLIAAGTVQTNENGISYCPEDASIEIPKTLRGLLGMAIERLPTPLVGVLHHASVLAPQFTVSLLATVAGFGEDEAHDAVVELVGRGIFTTVDQNRYLFAHGLLRDVVYDSINFTDRRDIHRRVATAIEQLHAPRLEAAYEQLALHYRESGQRQKAIEFLCLAGKKQADEGDAQTAAHHYWRAIELIHSTHQPEQARLLELFQALGECAVQANETAFGTEKLRLGRELAEETEDKNAQVTLLTLLGRLQDQAHRSGDAKRSFAQAYALSQDLEDPQLHQELLGEMGAALSRNGDHKEAADLLETALDLAQASHDKAKEIRYLCELSLCWAARGDAQRAQTLVERAQQRADEQSTAARCQATKYKGLVAYMLGQPEEALEAFSEALDQAKEAGLPYEIAANSHNVADLLIRTAHFGRAFTAARVSLEVAQQHGFDKLEKLNTMLLGFLDAVTLHSADGLALIEEALHFAREHDYTWDTIQASYFLGKACLEQGEKDRARQALGEVVQMARVVDSRFYLEDSQKLLATLGPQ